MQKLPPFSNEDIAAAIAHMQSAPLQNMHHAQRISDLIGRFSAFCSAVIKSQKDVDPGVVASQDRGSTDPRE